MARDTTNQQRDETTNRQGDQSTKTTNATSREAASTDAGRSTAAGDQSDRERSIRTERESGRSTGVTRRQPTSPAYGSSYGSAASPFALVRRMAENMDRLFEDFGFGRSAFGLSPMFGSDLDLSPARRDSALQAAWTPQVETFRRGDRLVVRADLPGMKKDDINVEVDDGMLTISGERCEEHEENEGESYRTERSYGQFYRAIPLPEGVNGESCDASFTDGVLEVSLAAPKEPERKAKRVQIR
jgi:HSP20 family protein